MKKLVLLTSLIAAATVSHASYLYWAVGTDQGDDLSAVTAYSKEEESGGTWTTATFYQAEINSEGKIVSKTKLEDMVNLDTSGDGKAGPLSVNLGDIDVSKSSYSYYIELANSTKVIGYASGTYTSLAASVTDAMPETLPAATIWHAGTYKATPEPTSAMLMLIGVAGLALRRKQRKA